MHARFLKGFTQLSQNIKVEPVRGSWIFSISSAAVAAQAAALWTPESMFGSDWIVI